MWLILTLLACVCFAAGAAMQKHGMAEAFPKLTVSRLRSELGRVLKTILRNWVWVLGLLVNLIGGGFFLFAVDQGEVSVVQPLVNLNLLLAMVIGVVALGERLRAVEWVGAAVMAVGGAVVVLSAEPVAGAAAVPDTMNAWVLGITIGGYALALGLALLRSSVRLSAELSYSVCSGILFGLNTVHIKLVSMHLGGAEMEFGALALAVISDPALWAIIPDNLLGFLFFQLAFANGRVAIVSPVTNIAAMSLPVLAGAVAYAEPVGALRLAGVAVVAAGIIVLVLPQTASPQAS